MTSLHLSRRIRRFTYVRRRTLAALAAALAVFSALRVLAPPSPDLVTVVAAAGDLSGGTTLTRADVATISLPADAVPEGALTSPDDAVGRTVSGPMAARSPVTEASISTGQALASPGHVVITLPLSDDTLGSLIVPGSTIDLIDPTDGSFMAQKVRVVAVPEASTGGLMATSDRAVLVDVSPDVAADITVAAQANGVAIALR